MPTLEIRVAPPFVFCICLMYLMFFWFYVDVLCIYSGRMLLFWFVSFFPEMAYVLWFYLTISLICFTDRFVSCLVHLERTKHWTQARVGKSQHLVLRLLARSECQIMVPYRYPLRHALAFHGLPDDCAAHRQSWIYPRSATCSVSFDKRV